MASRPYPVECTKTNDQDVVYDGAAASKLQQKQQQEEEEVSRPFPGDVWSPSPPPEQEMHDGFLEKMLFDESNEFEAPTVRKKFRRFVSHRELCKPYKTKYLG